MGRHPGAQYAAAALVAVAVLRDDRLGDRLLGRLSSLAARVAPTAAACSGWQSRAARSSADLAVLQAQRGPMMAQACRGFAAGDREDAGAADFARAHGRAAFGDQLRALPRRGRRGVKGYPNLNADRWLWGGKLDQIMQTITHGARCGRRSKTPPGLDAGLRSRRHAEARRDFDGRRLRAHAVRTSDRNGRRSRTRQEDLRRQLRRLPRRRGKGNHEMGAPDLTDQIWLYGAGQEDDHRAPLERARRRDAGLGRQARRRDHQDARRLRAHAGRRGMRHATRQPRRARDRRRHVAAAGQYLARRRRREAVRTSASDPTGGRNPTTRRRSTRRAGSIRKACRARSGASNGLCSSSRSASTTCCRSCAGIAGRTRRARRFWSILRIRRFYFFFIEIWPQEVYYFTGLLILAAMTLFLMNAVAGRLWCGYLCPQTVWTDLFITVERRIEGDRRERMLRDRQPWTLERAARTGREALPLAHDRVVDRRRLGSLFRRRADTGQGSRDIPGAVHRLCVRSAPDLHDLCARRLMREQVCVYMCPWPRIQAALTDEYALNVTYRYDRGEPRMSLKKAAAAARTGRPAGDCIDCLQCVARLPDRRRYSQRRQSRLHPVRPVHRRLRRGHGEDRPARAPHRL